MKLSLYTLLTSELSLDDSIAIAARSGFDAMDLRMHENGVHLLPDMTVDQAADLRRQVEDAGMVVSGLTTYYSVGTVDDAKWQDTLAGMDHALAVCSALGGACMRTSGPIVDLEAGWEAVRTAYRRQAMEAAELGARHGVIVTVEQHGGGVMMASAGQTLDLMRDLRHDFLGIVFDPGNCVFEGFERTRTQVDMLAPYIRAVHVKNMSPLPVDGPTESGIMAFESRRLDQGLIDWPDTTAALKARGYDGYLTLEDFHGFGSLDEKFAWDVDYLRGLIG